MFQKAFIQATRALKFPFSDIYLFGAKKDMVSVPYLTVFGFLLYSFFASS